MGEFLFPLGLIYRGFIFTRHINEISNICVRAENKSIGIKMEFLVNEDIYKTKICIKNIIDNLFETGAICH